MTQGFGQPIRLPKGFSIRAPMATDAAALLQLGRQLLSETDHFVRLPGERAQDIRDMLSIIGFFSDLPGRAMLNIWHGGEPVGEGVLTPGTLTRTAHVGSLGIGVTRDYWGRGLGQAMMARLEEAALAAGLERLEFTVLAHNARARDFYRRLGYREEGTRRNSVRYGADATGHIRYGDEVMMAKWIGPDIANPDAE